MKKFYVYDNDRPCNITGFPSFASPTWSNFFESFEEARSYAMKWINFEEESGNPILQLNIPYDYSGYGDRIDIRDEDDGEEVK